MSDSSIPFPTGDNDDEAEQDALDAEFGPAEGDDLSFEQLELERLYAQAMSAMESVADDLNTASDILSITDEEETDDAANDILADDAEVTSESDTADVTSSEPGLEPLESNDDPVEQPVLPAVAMASHLKAEPAISIETVIPGNDRVKPRQIVEAALFVGGGPLKTKKLVDMLGGEFSADDVDQMIDNLNQQYANEARPYGILFGEGGYRLTLHSEYHVVRDRAFGVGPKEVKLSQEALEILALVAYQQPISKQEVEEAGSSKSNTLLRQLLRRQLIALERGDDKNADVIYHTTSRFLEVFGLANLDELPHAADLNFK